MSGEVESSDFIAIQAETIIASMHGQPASKPLTLEKLLSEEEGIPIELGEIFSKAVNSLNGMGHEDLRFLLEQLDEESRIRLLSSFGYVKEFGWTPTELAKQPARTVQEFCHILNVMDEMGEEEKKKAEREAKRH